MSFDKGCQQYIPYDYFQVKAIDWQLSSPHIKENVFFCDVGGSSGTDDFPYIKAGAKCVCLDLDKKVLRDGVRKARATKLLGNIDYVQGSATHLPFRPWTFGLTTSYSVIDHTPNKKAAYQAIDEMARITKRNGHVVITVPNQLFILGTFMMAMKIFIQTDVFFEQRFTPKEMQRQCSKASLQVTKYGSKNPLLIGRSILRNNVPQLFQKLPIAFLRGVCHLAEELFKIADEHLPLQLLGARYGVDCVKR